MIAFIAIDSYDSYQLIAVIARGGGRQGRGREARALAGPSPRRGGGGENGPMAVLSRT